MVTRSASKRAASCTGPSVPTLSSLPVKRRRNAPAASVACPSDIDAPVLGNSQTRGHPSASEASCSSKAIMVGTSVGRTSLTASSSICSIGDGKSGLHPDEPSPGPLTAEADTRASVSGPARAAGLHPGLSSHQPSNSPKSENIFQNVKAAFRRCTTPSRLVGRELERKTISLFLRDHPLSGMPGSLYISGLPGTGKTALLDECCRNIANNISQLPFRLNIVKLNCMAISDPKSIYNSLLSSMGYSTGTISESSKLLESLLLSNAGGKDKKMPFYLFILDEIDQLANINQEILYKLFSWADHPTSRLALVGISNTVDLTSRLLPRLRTKNCEPQLLNFDPYKVAEITNIIKDRLAMTERKPLQATDLNSNIDPLTCGLLSITSPKSLEKGASLMQPMAIELAARKIAETGDIRKALDICRTAIELAELEGRQQRTGAGIENSHKSLKPEPLKLGSTDKTASSHLVQSLRASPIPKVTVRHILSATSSLIGSSSSNRINGLSMQLKLLLCTILILKRTRSADMSVEKVLQTYLSLCRFRNQINPLRRTEFLDLVTLLETQGLIHMTNGRSKEERSVKSVSLAVCFEDIEQAVSSVPILVTVLENSIEALGLSK
ncbi:hypothetical protein BASA50_010575 [Batrachochytrium salamandrivorans]|uniref:Cdc6 C-terminal domain-containing protein n=1 Tax=Batrachochytrium salamandrivorans TaxID=1357716 RepID=A0ABQ8EY62_9FUNG|nr:hypothetical protein BASA62_003297 [Batrachochytrium salamandrivorans]KAH6588704.1 hypothetical protein BASA50_010575 [Batrachochytrium salamandrivorans]